MNNSNNNPIISKFRFDFNHNSGYWLQNDEFQEIPKKNSGYGTIANQIFFILEPETNPSHWINYTLTFSRGKVWLTSWYKRVVNNITNYYKIRAEKTGDSMEIEFTEENEMIKVWNEAKQKDKWTAVKDLKK